MKNHMKKLLSLLLALGILVGSFAMTIPALATGLGVNLELGGGTLVDSDYVPTAGAALPNYEGITKSGVTFGGWYTDAEFTSAQAFIAEDNTTYYARWIKHTVNFTDFENYTDTSVVTSDGNNTTTNDFINNSNFYYWSSVSGSSVQLNADSAHAYSGTKSAKLIAKGAQSGSTEFGTQVLNWDLAVRGDGACFWVETENAVTIEFMLNGRRPANAKNDIVNLPAGKHLVVLPWKDTDKTTEWLWSTMFSIKHTTADNTVYIDSLGTYTNAIDGNITFNTNGGQWSSGYTAPDTYTTGMALPNLDNIKRDGLIFAGWYTNAAYSGTPAYVVPTTATGDLVYYARWVEHTVNFSDFEGYTDDSVITSLDPQNDGNTSNSGTNGFITDEAGGFYFWSGVANSTVQLSKDSANASSGNNSAKLVLKVKNSNTIYNTTQLGSQRVYFPTENVGDGICFWISTDKEISFDLQTNWSKASSKLTVPAGKHYIVIPWEQINANPWITLLRFTNSTEEVNVYIDDIGTFEDRLDNKLTFNLNGGEFANGYVAPIGYNTASGMALPNIDNMNNSGHTFAGWYDNARLQGNPVYSIEPGTSGDKEYYAKWLLHNVNFDNFNSYDNDADMLNANHWSDWKWPAQNAVTTLNTDAAHAYRGNSMKVVLNEANKNDELVVARVPYEITGDGIAFWVESTHGATVQFKFNGSGSYVSTPKTVPAGKCLVTIPWSEVSGTAAIWQTSLLVQVPNANGVVYIDEIGTYEEDTSSAATVTYILNGGSWASGYTAPTKYTTANVKLPTIGNINKEGFVFAGWYDNEALTGSPVFATSTPANITLYAKWVVHTANCDTFESYTSGTGQWVAWSSSATVALNTNTANAYVGNNSLKINVANNSAYSEKNAIAGGWVNYPIVGDGVSFWIKAETAADVTVYVGQGISGGATATVAVPAGRSFVTIPWSAFEGTLPDDSAWVTKVSVATPYGNGVTNTVYVDDLGTYVGNVKYTITYELGENTEWAQGYTAPTEYSDNGRDLPTYVNVKHKTNDKLTFIGWCEKADLSDAAVSGIAAGSSGNKTYYPKWAVHTASYETFENYKDTDDLTAEKTTSFWDNWAPDVSDLELNSDAAHTHYGNKSVKLSIQTSNASASIANPKKGISHLGDGIVLWVESEYSTTLSFTFNYVSSTNPGAKVNGIYIPAGKSFVSVPWSAVPESVRDSMWGVNIKIKAPDDGSKKTVYIDSIGTYSENADLAITYHLNDGSFVSGTNAAVTIDPMGETVLPTAEQVTKEGWYFAGWYTNENFTGAPVFTITPDSSAGREFWAKWVEQVNINHSFEDFETVEDMKKASWQDRIAYEGWNSYGGGFTLYLEEDASNLAPGSTKGLRGEYEVPDNEYLQYAGYVPAASFYNYSWGTVFGNRGTDREGDGFRFRIKSDRTVTMSITFLISGDPKNATSGSKITIPANVGVDVYLPWSYLNKPEAKTLANVGFNFYDSVGTTGKIWIDDLGIYYDEKLVPFIETNDDGDIKVQGYNNHIPKGTNVQIDKYSVSELTAMGGSLPAGASMAYLAEYNLRNAEGGLTTLYGNAWVSFKLPVGADTSKIGVYEVFFDGSLTPVNYTFVGNWVRIYALNPNGTILVTLNDTQWSAKGITIDENLVQPLTKTTTTTVIVDDGTEGSDDGSQNAVTEPETDNDTDTQTGTNRRPMREPLKSDNDAADTTSGGFPWWIILVICAGVLVIAAVIIIPIAVKRRRERN